MPESHLNFRYPKVKVRRKPVRTVAPRSDVRSGGGGRSGYSKPQHKPKPYQITSHPEKFVGGEGHGQMVDRRGSGEKERRAAGRQARQTLITLLLRTPVGAGLTSASAEALWKKARPYYGTTKGSHVPVEIMPLTTHGGQAPWDRRTVRLDTTYAKDLLPLVGGDAGKKLLLHEWAHARQKIGAKQYRTKGGRARAEGGAEAFAQTVGPLIGLKRQPSIYGEFEKAFRRKYGLKGVLHDQFRGS